MREIKPLLNSADMLAIPEPARKAIGSVLAALYLKGIYQVKVTRENLEDDLWSIVRISRYDDVETGGVMVTWSIQGLPRVEPGKIVTTEKVYLKQPWMLQPWFLVPTFTILGMVLGFLMGIA